MIRGLFWCSTLALIWTQALYGLVLAWFARGRPVAPGGTVAPGAEPSVSLVVAAYAEEAVIAGKVADALALDWPRERLEVVVAVDGGAGAGADATARLAREAGADLVLELPRGGKMRAQDAAVAAASHDLVAFSDANARWAPDALRELVGAFADPRVAYACGNVAFVNAAGTNQEGLYWRYDLWQRAHESALGSVTAGNGAIYAVRRDDYRVFDPPMGHDLSFPFTMVKAGRRAVYVPTARATEAMVPSIEGEWARKRRMMTRAWEIVLRSGLTDPRGYPAGYLGMVVSHRVLRYLSPLLHVAALATAALLSRRRLYRALLAAQLALLAAAVAGGRVRARPLLLARYYVLTTASIGAGLADYLRHGVPAGWEPAEGTR